jgi:hypothetical protein
MFIDYIVLVLNVNFVVRDCACALREASVFLGVASTPTTETPHQKNWQPFLDGLELIVLSEHSIWCPSVIQSVHGAEHYACV